MDTVRSMFSTVLNNLVEINENLEQYLEKPTSEVKSFENITKDLFKQSVDANSLTRLKANSLPKLLVDGFDEEQIWQQIELQNNSAVLHFSNNVSKFDIGGLTFGVNTENGSMQNENLDQNDISHPQSLSDDENQDLPLDTEESDDAIDFGDQNQGFEDGDSDEDMEIMKSKSVLKKSAQKGGENLNDLSEDADESDEAVDFGEQNQAFEDGDSDEDMEIGKLKSILKKSAHKDVELTDHESPPLDRSEKKSNRRNYGSEVDDQFFKLSKLEQFLRVEDLKEERARDGDLKEGKESDDDEDLSENDDIDLFQNILSDEFDDEDESENEEVTNKKSSRDFMYEDFFDAPDSGDENVDEDLEQDDDLDNDEMDLSRDNESLEDDEDLQTESAPNSVPQFSQEISKTPFELEQEKVKQQIEEYEGKMLKPAAWHLTGEVDSNARPIDALLHLQTDFEMNAKPVVVQDQSLCKKLEDLLKMTIKNKSFSDGVKQYKTNDEIISKKKEIVIEQTKSKKSLAEEYEDMYLKKKNGQQEEENPKHVEIKKLMDSLFPELHALFSHIPKPAIPEMKIVSNLPAISVEEVAPTSVSDVTLLAPEEVKRRTGVIKGQTERTDVDRKRERRKKKFHQKMKQKKNEKESSDKPLSAKAQKREKLDMIRKLKQQRNTKFAKMDGQKIKSSKDFFERLQDTVSSTVQRMRAKKS